jgi:CBS domain-containing membrane protein
VRLFKPLLAGVQTRDRLLACVGAALGIGFAIAIASALPFRGADFPLIVAPLGASAVLVFAVPSSPMAQPWPVIGGNTISALVGIMAYQAIPDFGVAASVAVGLAILLMSLCRCLHPPGGASALTAVIGSEAIHAAGFSFALMPVALNSICLVALAWVFHRLSRKSYPHITVPPPASASGLRLADIDAALADMGESFDISRADLDALLSRAEIHAAKRR